MFEFGDPVEIARTWVEEASATGGTGLTGLHYEDLEENQLRDLFIYLRIAYFRASRDGASDEVMEILLRWYDEVFLYDGISTIQLTANSRHLDGNIS